MDVELLLDAHATIGDSPTWWPAGNAIYWIDVKRPALHRLDLGTREDREWLMTCDLGAFALARGGTEALLALRHGLFTVDLDSGAMKEVAPPPFDPTLFRFNEGACDSSGRFWVGVMFDPLPGVVAPPQPACLHSYTAAGGLRPEPDAAELHNGMAWDATEQLFYLSHSQQQTIYAYRFEPSAGRIGERTVFASVPSALGLPDGAAIDEAGGYWCALHGGSRLRRYRADGSHDRDIMLPVSQPTMCAFAGQDLDLLVVTSARDRLSPQQLEQEPHAGALFCCQPGVRGIPRPSMVR